MTTMMMNEIAFVTNQCEEEETRKTAKKRPFVAFSVENLILIENIFFFFFSLLNPEFFTQNFFSLLFDENALFWSVFFRVFVRKSFLSLCICASELENFL